MARSKTARVQPKRKKKTSRSRRRDRGVRLSKAELAQIERELDRYMERWARHAIILEEGGPRRLTDEEVRMAARQSRPSRRPSSSRKAGKKR